MIEIEYSCVCGKERAWDETHCPECQQTQSESKGEGEMKNQAKAIVVQKQSSAQITRDAIEQKAKAVAVQQDQSPADMIRFAIEKGADLDKLEKLMALKREWDRDEARKAYNVAMTAFKQSPPKIFKDKTVSFAQTKYNHATLGNVAETISSELSKHGLSASWTTKQNGSVVVTCRITHVLGHSEETSLAAESDKSGSKNSIQAIGSTITYLERYTLLAITGLATYEQDDDGRSAEVVRITDAQLSTLRDLMASKGIEGKAAKLCGILKVDSLETLPATDYDKAVKLINAAKGAQK